MNYTNLCAVAQRALASILLLVAALVTVGFGHDRDDDTVRVMTRNLYQGTNFDALLSATPATFLTQAGIALSNVRASKPAERAAAVAREIVRNRVDLVGIQEATIIRTGPIQAFPAECIVPSCDDRGVGQLAASSRRAPQAWRAIRGRSGRPRPRR